jgi:hypothetical protein
LGPTKGDIPNQWTGTDNVNAFKCLGNLIKPGCERDLESKKLLEKFVASHVG